MYASENEMIVTDALQRIDGILALQPLPAAAAPETPKDNSVTLRNVVFRYPNASQNGAGWDWDGDKTGENMLPLWGLPAGGKRRLPA